MGLGSIVRMLAITAGAAGAAFVLNRAAESVARRLSGRRPGSPVLALLRTCRRPLQLAIGATLLLLGEPWAALPLRMRGECGTCCCSARSSAVRGWRPGWWRW